MTTTKTTIDVFLSRPTRLDRRFGDPLGKFVKFLNGHGLHPRTLGTTEYTIENPLDAVLALMKSCRGALILGYPQIRMTAGLVKGRRLRTGTTEIFPTPWNHIEAVLAYKKRAPLLIVRHQGVGGGVFDRGVLPGYVFETNLGQKDWFKSPDIAGAFPQWLAAVRKA